VQGLGFALAGAVARLLRLGPFREEEEFMSEWNHPLCDRCWTTQFGERVPHRLVEPLAERCCRCGEFTESGIYYREDPAKMPRHEPHGE
jgi:hypothetical protein